MRPAPALLAIALASLPAIAHAQSLTASHAEAASGSTAGSEAVRSDGPSVAVRLTHRGLHAQPAHTLVEGLSVVDEQRADVDGDGDEDALLLADVADGADASKPDLGRGIVIAYRERHGWRAQTVGSLRLGAATAGFNWGRVEAFRAGAAPLVHAMYSEAGPGGGVQRDIVMRFERGTLRPVYERAVESGDGIVRSLDIQAADVDHDGTAELLERVASSAHCPDEGGCVGVDGMVAPQVTRRVMRWDGAREAFVELAPETAHGLHTDATRAFEVAMDRARAGDDAGRDAHLTQAYGLDPLDARVRLAYARMLLRTGHYAPALDTLEFAWPAGYGRDALVLSAEAAAHSGRAECGLYVAQVRETDPVRGAELAGRLGPLSSNCDPK